MLLELLIGGSLLDFLVPEIRPVRAILYASNGRLCASALSDADRAGSLSDKLLIKIYVLTIQNLEINWVSETPKSSVQLKLKIQIRLLVAV